MVTFDFGVDEIVLFTSIQPTNEPTNVLFGNRLKTLTTNKILDRQRGAAAATADSNPKIFRGTTKNQAKMLASTI